MKIRKVLISIVLVAVLMIGIGQGMTAANADGDFSISVNTLELTVGNSAALTVTTELEVQWEVTNNNSAVKLYTDEGCTTEYENQSIKTIYVKGVEAGSANVNVNSTTNGTSYSEQCGVTVSKATPTISNLSTSTTYGQTLSDLKNWLDAQKPLGIADAPVTGSWAWVEASNTSVGSVGTQTHQATFTPSGDDATNYNSLTCTISVEVSAKAFSEGDVVFGVETSFTYNGSAQAPTVTVKDGSNTLQENTDYTISYKRFNNTVWENTAEHKDAGRYKVVVTGTGNYTGSVEKEFAIGKAVPTLSVTAGAITYGQTLANSSLTGSAATGVNNEAVTGSFAWKTAGTTAPTVSDSGTTEYEVTFTSSDDNYENKDTTVKLTVNPKQLNQDGTSNPADGFTVTLDHDSFTYTGSRQTPTTTVKDGTSTLTEGTDYTLSYKVSSNSTWTDATEQENAGIYKVVVTGKGNYTGCLEKEFSINPASVTLTANSGTETYDGALKTVEGFTSSKIGLSFTGVSATGSGTNAGEYPVTFTGVTVNTTKDTTGNYVVSETANGKLTIDPAEVTLTASSGTETYDGEEKTVTGFTASVDGLNFTGVSASGSGTNAGEYPVTFSGVTVNTTKDTTGNYVVKGITNGKLTINPAEVTLTANSGTETYDGTEKTVTGFTASVTGLIFTGVSATGSGTSAGTYDVEFTGVTINTTKDSNGNYVVTGTTKGTLTINPAEVTLTASSGTETYDGTEKTVTGFKASIDGLTFTNVTASGKGTEAGGYSVEFSGVTAGTTKDSTGNYVVSGTTIGTLTINPTTADWAISLEGSTHTYNGEPKAITNTPQTTALTGTTTYTFSFELGGTYVSDLSTLTKTDAGKYTVYVKGTNPNYSSTTSTSTSLTIDAATVTIPTAVTGMKWTGKEQTGVAAGDGYTVTNGKKTDVGSYTATATLTSTNNYKWSDGTTAAKSITWSIAKADAPAAPTGLTGVAPTTENGSDGKITGVTSEMEYSTKSDFSSETACTGTEITSLTAGTYYVRLKETATHKAGSAATVTVPAYVPKEITATAAGFTGAYDGQAHGIGVKVTDPASGAAVKYSTDGSTYNLTDSPKITNVADSPLKVYYQITAAGYTTKTGNATVTISKANAAVATAPTAITGLIENGNNQALVKAGTASSGSMQYALGTNATTAPTIGWSATVPSGKDVATYYVWYKAAGENYNDSEAKCVAVSIAVDQAAAADQAAADDVIVKINAIGTVEYTEASKAKIDEAKAAYSKLTDAQKALVTNAATLSDAEAKYTELKAAAEQAAADETAVKNVADLIAAIPAEITTDEDKAKVEAARKAYDALTDAQKAKVSADDLKKLTDAEAVVAELAKPAAEVEKAPEANTLTFDGTEQALVTEGTASNGTMQYALGTDAEKVPAEGWSSAVPTGKDVGTYYVWYKAIGNEGYRDSEAKFVTVTIAEAPEIYIVKVTVSDENAGEASAEPSSGPAGTEIKMIATAKNGYVFKEWKVISGDVEVKDNVFILGAANVAIQAVFEESRDVAFMAITVEDQVYTGKKLRPEVTVRTVSGKELEKKTDYTVAYASNKNIGTATVTVTGKGDYTGTAKATFTIKPPAVELLSLKVGKKQLTVKWEKANKKAKVTGYEIQYAAKNTFENATTVTVKKAATVKTVIKKLKKGTYFVRVRNFKTVKGTKVYSDWSDWLKAKVK